MQRMIEFSDTQGLGQNINEFDLATDVNNPVEEDMFGTFVPGLRFLITQKWE